MTFIIVLIAVLLERFVEGVQHLRSWAWLAGYTAYLDRKLGRTVNAAPYLRLAIIIIPFLIVTALIEALLMAYHLVWLQFIFNCLVALYCMGPCNVYSFLKKSIDKKSADKEEATVDVSHETESQVAYLHSPHETYCDETDEDPKHALVDVNSFLFAMLFWFVCLGPVGAVWYRLSYQSQAGDVAAKKITALLNWVPARLFSFTYALIGHFTAVIPLWLSRVVSPISENDKLLKECGEKTLTLPSADLALQIRSLIDRGLIVWLVVLAAVFLV